MSNISEESGNILGHQKSTRPAKFTKLATYLGILGWFFILILLLMMQLQPPGSIEYIASEDQAAYWLTAIVALFATLLAVMLMLIGLIFALVGTVRRERGRWLAAAWLVPASIVPLYLILLWYRVA